MIEKPITNCSTSDGKVKTFCETYSTTATTKPIFIQSPKFEEPIHLWNFEMIDGKLVKVH